MVTTTVRFLLGLFLLTMGLNKFFQFLPPMPLSSEGTQVMTDLMATGFVMQMVAVTEILTGLLFLSERWTPFAVVLLAPLSISIMTFHLTSDLSSMSLGAMVFVANVFLALQYFDYFRPIFAMALNEEIIISDSRRIKLHSNDFEKAS